MSQAGLVPAKKKTLTDYAAEQLETAIRDGTLLPGTHLSETALGMRLGMSRIPLR